MALASGISTSIKLFFAPCFHTINKMAAVFMLVSSSWASFGDARELKKIGEHSPTRNTYILFVHKFLEG